MEYRLLGRTGVRVSVLGIGSWQLSGPLTLDGKADGFSDPGKEKVIDLIRACGDLGINLIDSAELYGDGEGERRIGEAIRGKRERWILTTKFGMRKGTNGQRIVDARPSIIRPSLEGSLKRLNTDYVDIYLYHSPPGPQSIAEGKEILEKLKQEGEIRFYGISTNDPETLCQLVNQNAADVVMLSQSLLTHPSKLLKLAQRHNLGIMVRGALEGGRLSGKYFHARPEFPAHDIRKQASQGIDFQKYAAYERFFPEGVPMAAFALRYLVDFATTHTIVLGGRSIEQYRNALRALDLLSLDPKTHRALRKVRSKLVAQPLAWRILRRVHQKVEHVLNRV